MVSKDDVLAQFELFNIKPDEAVLKKCIEICNEHQLDEETFVDAWFAYTTSHLKGAAPTVAYLEQMQRKEFSKNKDILVKKTVVLEQHTPPSPSVHATPTDSTAKTPKGNHAPLSRIQTPVQPKKLLDESMDYSTITSPSAPSNTFSKRTNALSVRCSYGNAEAQFKRSNKIELQIKPFYHDGLRPSTRFMYEVLKKRAKSLDNMTEDLAKLICQKYILQAPDEFNQSQIELSGDQVLVYGRILSDVDGKINSQSILLEQTQKFKGRKLSLNVSKVNKYSLFSGQVVCVKGTYLRAVNKRDTLVADAIYTDTEFNFPKEIPLAEGTLQLVIACGPFTVQDCLLFEPLNDLLQYVKEHKPHVLLLTGPFYDKTHQGILNGELKQSFDSFFLDLIDNVMKEIPVETHVIFVASQKEPHHFPVYPTPPYQVRQDYANLTFMPDPCLVNVNGLLIGTTTADILFHIGGFEMNVDKTLNSGPPDRMARLASHLLKQQIFYPLDPPAKDVFMDFSLMERNGVMEAKPHLLILPSNLRHFVKEIDNVIVINPERLTKGNGGGTFARLEISPGSNPTLCGRTACQVLSI